MTTSGAMAGADVGPRLRRFATTSTAMLALAVLSMIAVASMAGPMFCAAAPGNAAGACVVLPALQLTLGMAALAALACAVLGGAVGLLSALLPRLFCDALGVVLDGCRAVPVLLWALVASALLGHGIAPTILAIMVAVTPWAMRRAHEIACRERDSPYVRAAQGLGLSHVRIALAHVAPNAFGPITVLLLDQLALAVLLETTVSFLGLGLGARAASLGTLLATTTWPGALTSSVALIASVRVLRRALDDVQAAGAERKP